MKKRMVSLALAMVMVLAVLPVGAMAAEITATEVIPCKYDAVGSFSEGLAAVELDGKWGYIDKTGKEVIPLKYDYALGFSEGLAQVKLNDKYGYIDKTGNEVVPLKYDGTGTFSGGLAAVLVGNRQVDGWGFIDKTGKEVTPLKYEYHRNFSEGLMAVSEKIHKGGNGSSGLGSGDVATGIWGFIDETGKEVIPCQYHRAWDFSDGLALVEKDSGEKNEWGGPIYRFGFIDKTGREVIPCKYDDASYGGFCEGLAAVCLDGKWSYIDKTGKEVISLDGYVRGRDFSDGLAGVTKDSGEKGEWDNTIYRSGYIDKTGTLVIPCQYGDDVGPFSEGVAVAEDPYYRGLCLYALIDKTGKLLTSYKWYQVDTFSDGLAMACSNESDFCWGFIDKTGKEVIPCKYGEVSRGGFCEGLAAVRLDGKYGYIDKTGKEVVPFKYDWALDFSEGLAAVELNGKWGFVAIRSAEPTTYTAKPTNDALKVDGKAQVPTAYKIGDSNYFQLRDVAMMLNGTPAQFSVDYDEARQAVVIVTGEAYTPKGWELGGAAQNSTEAILGNNDIYINGVKTDFAVYKIGGANFFQIRALGQALGFNVGWTAEQGMFIESDKPYVSP